MNTLSQQFSRGDTIIEVLIAVAIVSLVITSAYLIAGNRMAAVQGAQEQSFAQKLVEQQTELLRSAPVLPTAQGCYDTTVPVPIYVTSPTTYDPCLVTNGGAEYTLSIIPPSPSQTSYTIRALWENPNGQQSQVTAYYRGVATP